jgi:hypothetical protein
MEHLLQSTLITHDRAVNEDKIPTQSTGIQAKVETKTQIIQTNGAIEDKEAQLCAIIKKLITTMLISNSKEYVLNTIVGSVKRQEIVKEIMKGAWIENENKEKPMVMNDNFKANKKRQGSESSRGRSQTPAPQLS